MEGGKICQIAKRGAWNKRGGWNFWKKLVHKSNKQEWRVEKSKISINVEGGFLFCGVWNFLKMVSVGSTFIREMRVYDYNYIRAVCLPLSANKPPITLPVSPSRFHPPGVTLPVTTSQCHPPGVNLPV